MGAGNPNSGPRAYRLHQLSHPSHPLICILLLTSPVFLITYVSINCKTLSIVFIKDINPLILICLILYSENRQKLSFICGIPAMYDIVQGIKEDTK